MTDYADHFLTKSWVSFPTDPELLEWVREIRPLALALAEDAGLQASWLRCGGTWFAGVNVLPNDPAGEIGQSGPLRGMAVNFVKSTLAPQSFGWDKAQISVCYQAYPLPSNEETEGNFRFRRDRDSAHIDGLLPVGPDRRRFLRERHGFILGIPLTSVPAGAAPFVVWEGSHKLIREAFTDAFAGVDPDQWENVDVTGIYQEVRREIWQQCSRVEIPAKPGEAYVVHRQALHGVAPWPSELDGPLHGRAIAYFRPDTGAGNLAWLSAP